MMATNNITICSYNAKHYDTIKYNIVKELFGQCNILFLQETWLTEKEFIRKFKNDFPNRGILCEFTQKSEKIAPLRLRFQRNSVYRIVFP